MTLKVTDNQYARLSWRQLGFLYQLRQLSHVTESITTLIRAFVSSRVA